MTDDDLTPEERGAALLAKFANNLPKVEPPKPDPTKFKWDPDLIPDVDNSPAPKDTRLTAVLDNIGITEAYIRFIGKMTPDTTRSRTEGVMISCPMPEHRDSNPSAWMNTEKGTWFCGGCQQGGDKYDLGAIHFNYPLHSYKNDGSFVNLAREMAESFGYTVVKGTVDTYAVKEETSPNPQVLPQPVTNPAVPFGQPKPPGIVMAPQAAPSAIPAPSNLPAPEVRIEVEGQDAKVIPLFGGDGSEENDEEAFDPSARLYIPWEEIAEPDTFLREWMNATTIDDLPHEFYFWLGLQALGFIGGNETVLLDYKPVKPNLFVCLYGRTGIGKSRSADPYIRLLQKVFSYSQDPKPQGVKIVQTPNSAEYLIDQFVADEKDASTGQITKHSIKGLVRYEELSALVSKSFGKGSSLRETFIELFDVYEDDVTTGSRGSGQVKAHNPFVQMLSTTQPNAIHAFLRKTDIESGFLNRWIFAAGRPRVAPISYGGVAQDITGASVLLRTAAAWAMGGKRYVLEGDALKEWDHFFQNELAKFKSGQTEMESIVSRIDLVLKKIIILLCLNEQLDQPTPEVVQRAIKLYPYLMTTYAIFGKDIVFDEATELQSRIIKTVVSHQTRKSSFPSKSQIWRQLAGKYQMQMFSTQFKFMVDVGVLIEHAPAALSQAGQRGRPTTRYEYVGA